MKRVKDTGGVVHFCGAREGVTLCGIVNSDLFHAPTPFVGTSERVTCPDCAKLYCRVKNAPWNEVADAAMDHGMYACGDRVWCGACANRECPDCGKDCIVPCDKFINEGTEP